MRPGFRIALAASAVLHAAFAAAMWRGAALREVAQQPRAEVALGLATDPVAQQVAIPADARGEAAAEGQPEPLSGRAGTVTLADATPVVPRVSAADSATPRADAAARAGAEGQTLTAQAGAADRAASGRVPSSRAAEADLPGTSVVGTTPRSDTAERGGPAVTAARPGTASAASVVSRSPPAANQAPRRDASASDAVAPVVVEAEPAGETAAPPGSAVSASIPQGRPLRDAIPQAASAAELILPPDASSPSLPTKAPVAAERRPSSDEVEPRRPRSDAPAALALPSAEPGPLRQPEVSRLAAVQSAGAESLRLGLNADAAAATAPDPRMQAPVSGFASMVPAMAASDESAVASMIESRPAHAVDGDVRDATQIGLPPATIAPKAAPDAFDVEVPPVEGPAVEALDVAAFATPSMIADPAVLRVDPAVSRQATDPPLDAAASGQSVPSREPKAARAAPAQADGATAAQVDPAGPLAPPAQASATPLQQGATPGLRLRLAPATGREAPRTTPKRAAGTERPAPAAEAALEHVTPGARLTAAVPPGAAAGRLSLPSETAQAELGWTGALGENLDAVTLAAVQSFVAPAARSASTARDAISELLMALPCSRVRGIFDPESGTLQLRGHVPDAATEQLLMAGLSSLIGDAIPVDPDLRRLPPPQCAVLPMVEALGLPQSDAHLDDPRVVGPDAHVREETYVEGDRIALEVESPEYPAHLLVDYFDATGAVIHLLPNEFLASERLPPETTIHLGGRIADGASFELEVTPPFNKEIAVAYASTAPLVTEPRPLVEAAEPYLDWLRQRIAAARAETPGFRGEWAYFFITTQAAD